MYLACGNKSQLALAYEGIQIRLMLEEVGIQLLIIERQIRLYIIAELNDLQVYALFSQRRLDIIKDFSVRYSSCTNLQRHLFVSGRCLFVIAATAGSDYCQAHKSQQSY